MRDHWCRGDHWCPGIILSPVSWSLCDPGPSVGCWFRSQAKLPGAGTGERFRFAGSFLWPLVRPLGSSGSQKAPALISGSSGLSGNSGNASTALPPLPGNHWLPVWTAQPWVRGEDQKLIRQDKISGTGYKSLLSQVNNSQRRSHCFELYNVWSNVILCWVRCRYSTASLLQ